MVVKKGNEDPLPFPMRAAPDRGLLAAASKPGRMVSPPIFLYNLKEKAAGSNSLRSSRCQRKPSGGENSWVVKVLHRAEVQS